MTPRADLPPMLRRPPQFSNFVVYGFYTAGLDCLYIGQTSDLQVRLSSHHSRTPWYGEAAVVVVMAYVETRERAEELERQLIRQIRPAYNIQGLGRRSRLVAA